MGARSSYHLQGWATVSQEEFLASLWPRAGIQSSRKRAQLRVSEQQRNRCGIMLTNMLESRSPELAGNPLLKVSGRLFTGRCFTWAFNYKIPQEEVRVGSWPPGVTDCLHNMGTVQIGCQAGASCHTLQGPGLTRRQTLIPYSVCQCPLLIKPYLSAINTLFKRPISIFSE